MDKQFGVSFLTSNKAWCPGHRLRVDCYRRIPDKVGDAPITKYMSPPRIPNKNAFLVPWQFSIAVENAYHNNWFADKIIDCFLARTIPIYWGCPNLHEFFNLGGVFRFNSYEELIEQIQSLKPTTYESLLPTIEDNYNRALKYVPIWNRIENVIDNEVKKKKLPVVGEKKPHLYLSSTMGDMHPPRFSPPTKTWPHNISITFDDGCSIGDRSDLRIHVQCEPPEVLNAVDQIIKHHKQYDLLLAWNENILKACSNAILFPHTETLGPGIGRM